MIAKTPKKPNNIDANIILGSATLFATIVGLTFWFIEAEDRRLNRESSRSNATNAYMQRLDEIRNTNFDAKYTIQSLRDIGTHIDEIDLTGLFISQIEIFSDEYTDNYIDLTGTNLQFIRLHSTESNTPNIIINNTNINSIDSNNLNILIEGDSTIGDFHAANGTVYISNKIDQNPNTIYISAFRVYNVDVKYASGNILINRAAIDSNSTWQLYDVNNNYSFGTDRVVGAAPGNQYDPAYHGYVQIREHIVFDLELHIFFSAGSDSTLYFNPECEHNNTNDIEIIDLKCYFGSLSYIPPTGIEF